MVETSFTIKPKSITTATVTPEYTTTKFDITRKRPTAIVMDGTKELVSGTDFTYGYSNNMEAGTATLYIKGKGNYTGTYKTYFTITPKDVSELTYKINSSSVVYDGSKKVYDGNKYLVHGVNYYTEYSNNINVGTATVKVIGMGSYSGTLNKTFEITKKPITDCTVTIDCPNNVYDGNTKSITVTVKDGDKVLEKGKDYTLNGPSIGANAGTKTIYITGQGNYSGIKSESFEIAPKSIKNCTVTVDCPNKVYDGKAKSFTVTVKDGNKALEKGKDYDFTYDNNIDVGTVTVTVNGLGNYTGQAFGTFDITAKSLNDCDVSLYAYSFVYSGSGQPCHPSVTIKNGTDNLRLGTDFFVNYQRISNGGNYNDAGQYKVTITGNGNYTDTVYQYFEIEKLPVTELNIFIDEKPKYNYNYRKTFKQITTSVNTSNYGVTYSFNEDNSITASITGKNNCTGTVDFTYNPISQTSFAWGRDNWSFDNTGTYFTDYSVNDTVMDTMRSQMCLSDTDYANLQDNIAEGNRKGWGGSCYGMSVTSILAKEGYLNPTLGNGTFVVHDYTPTSATSQDNVISTINFIHNLQCTCSFTDLKDYAYMYHRSYSEKQYFEKAEEFFDNNKGNNSLIQLSYAMCNNIENKTAGHAVVAYGYESCRYYSSVTNLTYNKRLLISDPNFGSKNGVTANACIYYDEDGSWICPYWNNNACTCYWTNPERTGKTLNDSYKTGYIKNMILHISLTDTQDIMSGKSWIYNHDKNYYEMNNNGYLTAINDSYSAEKDFVNDTYDLCINRYTAENEALFGDIDLDGEVNVNDVTLLSNYLAELAALDDAQLYAADVDHDGNVSIADVMYLQFYLAELV